MSDHLNAQRLLTAREASEFLKICEVTLRKLTKVGEIRGVAFGFGQRRRHVHYDPADYVPFGVVTIAVPAIVGQAVIGRGRVAGINTIVVGVIRVRLVRLIVCLQLTRGIVRVVLRRDVSRVDVLRHAVGRVVGPRLSDLRGIGRRVHEAGEPDILRLSTKHQRLQAAVTIGVAWILPATAGWIEVTSLPLYCPTAARKPKRYENAHNDQNEYSAPNTDPQNRATE